MLKEKLKRAMSVVLASALSLTMLPTMSLTTAAAISKRTATLDVRTMGATNYLSTEGWAWSTTSTTVDGTTYSGNVLVLSGADIDVPNGNGILLPATATVVLAKDSINYVKSGYRSANGDSGCIYSANGTITFDGAGTLYAESTAAPGGGGSENGGNGISTGEQGTINVKDGFINSVGTYGQSGFASRNINISGGVVYATGAVGADGSNPGGGNGIWAGNTIQLTGGMIVGRTQVIQGGQPNVVNLRQNAR